MKLMILGSSSKGNCYLLIGKEETLIIEAGINIKEVKKALEFDLKSVVGCLITHEHGDHSKYIKEYIDAGIDIYASKGTFDALKIESHHRLKTVISENKYNIKGFTIMPFDTKHDCIEPLGYLIRHNEIGTILFATDTYYLEYKFSGLNHVLIECNYSLDILNKNVEKGYIHPIQKKRVMRSHFGLENVKEFLRVNDLSHVYNIILLHLSDSNSNAKKFKKQIYKLTNRKVFIANRGLEVILDKYPF